MCSVTKETMERKKKRLIEKIREKKIRLIISTIYGTNNKSAFFHV